MADQSNYGVAADAVNAYNLLMQATPINIDTIDLTSDLYKIPSDTSSGAYQEVLKLTNEDLSQGKIDGTGTFDVLMQAAKAILREEYDKGRITAAEYTKAFTAMMEAAMQNAVQFLIQRDQAYWQSVNSQVAMVTARVGLETAKYQAITARIAGETGKAELALTKAKIGTEDAQFGQLSYTVDKILPQQLAQAVATVTNLTAQLVGIKEQGEAARAQTMDTRSDNVTPIAGLVGKQKASADKQVALYDQQITSYKRDAEVKMAKIFSDAWITMKSIDEGITAPTGFSNGSLDQILSLLKVNNGVTG